MITRRERFQNAAVGEAPPPVPPWVFMAAAVFQLALNFVFPTGSILFGAALVSVMVWLARAEYLPAILITQFAKTDFLLSGYGTYDYAFSQFEAGSLVIAGFPVSVNYFLGFSLCGRVFWEWLHRPETFRSAQVSWLLPLWVFAMVPAAIMSLLGRAEYNASWTGTIRMVFMAGALFYGVILARTWPHDGRILTRWFVPLFGVLFALAAVGHFSYRILWIMPTFTAAMVWFAWRRGALLDRTLALITFLLSAAYCLGLVRGRETSDASYVAGILGTSSSTFTLNAILLVAVLVALVLMLRTGLLKQGAVLLLSWPAFLTVVIFSFGAAALYTQFAGQNSSLRQTDMTALERLQSKIFDDRARIWHGGLQDIQEPPYVLLPAGRPLIINDPTAGWIVWTPGAHNTIFEVLRTQRWINGPIILLFVLVLMVRCARVLDLGVPDSFKVLAAGTLVTATVGVATGHYPLSDQAAFWFLCLGGIPTGVSAVPIRSRLRPGLRLRLLARRLSPG